MATTSEPAATTGGDITRLPRNSPRCTTRFSGARNRTGGTPKDLDRPSAAFACASFAAASVMPLGGFSWGITALRQLFASGDGAISSPPAPYHLSVPGRETFKPSCETEPAQIHLQLPRSLSDRGYTPICGLRDVRQFTLPGVTPNCLTAEAPTIAELAAVLALRRAAGIVNLASVD
jgi:hypothetical protein